MENSNNNYKYWKMGIFYYNPENPLFFVRKPNNTGWTVNFGNKKLFLLVFFISAIIIAFYVTNRR